jgi:hypothetical protein
LLGLPLFIFLKSNAGRKAMNAVSRWLSKGWCLYLPILLLFILESHLRYRYPGYRDVAHDWASFDQWFFVFVTGFLFASHANLFDRAQAIRVISLVLAIICTWILFAQFYADGEFKLGVHGPIDPGHYVWLCLVRVANLWFWLLALTGFASRYLRGRRSAVLDYLNDAVYPLYCLHLPIIVALAFVIVPLSWPVWPKYIVITSMTVLLTLLCYEVLKRISWARPLVGLKLTSRARVAANGREGSVEASG